jgi:hypothetical protein
VHVELGGQGALVLADPLLVLHHLRPRLQGCVCVCVCVRACVCLRLGLQERVCVNERETRRRRKGGGEGRADGGEWGRRRERKES